MGAGGEGEKVKKALGAARHICVLTHLFKSSWLWRCCLSIKEIFFQESKPLRSVRLEEL